MMLNLGTRVKLQKDNGWSSPGCVMSSYGGKLRVYWPDENVFTDERPDDLLPYGDESANQPHEAAA